MLFCVLMYRHKADDVMPFDNVMAESVDDFCLGFLYLNLWYTRA